MNQVASRADQPVSTISPSIVSSVLLDGDLAKLNDGDRVKYMLHVCQSLGLNPATKPFEFLRLNGKLVMYARRDCTEQLRKLHGVSIEIKAREVVSATYVVTATAKDAQGRVDESIGAVSIEGLKGENLSNAMMKAETKAKRRVTLSICGLGLLDESEVSSVPGVQLPADQEHAAKREKVATVTGEVKERKPEWSEDQLARLGKLRAEGLPLDPKCEAEMVQTWKRMKYDDPEDTLTAMEKVLRMWQDIADQANTNAGATP